jgi:hypothetical protein
VAHNFKERVGEQMSNVAPSASIEIVNTKDLMALIEKLLAQMGPDKSYTTGDKDPFA